MKRSVQIAAVLLAAGLACGLRAAPPDEGMGMKGPGPMARARHGGPGPECRLLQALTRNPEVGAKLGLEPAQLEALKKSALDGQLAMVDLEAKVRKAELEKAYLMGQEKVDEARLMQLIETIGGAQVEIEKQRVKQVLGLKSILTPEQRERLRDLAAERLAERAGGEKRPGNPEMRGRERMRERARRWRAGGPGPDEHEAEGGEEEDEK